jgi:hypothetical protein
MNVTVGECGSPLLASGRAQHEAGSDEKIIDAYILHALRKASFYVTEGLGHETFGRSLIREVEGGCINEIETEELLADGGVIDLNVNGGSSDVRGMAARPLDKFCNRRELIIGGSLRDVACVEEEPQKGSFTCSKG